METTTFTFTEPAGIVIHTYRWTPDGDPVGTIQIAHGMGEHAGRYARLAGALTDAGWAVYANDHPGHGRSVVNRSAAPEVGPGGLGDLGPGGWDGLVDVQVHLNSVMGEEFPERPKVLLGHSMGSFAAQQYVLDHSRDIDALVLSGSTAVDLAAAAIDTTEGADLTGLNAPFEPARTPFDWLSRDEAEVDLYVADPWCGFGLDAASASTMVAGAPRLAEAEALAGIRSDLPIFMVAGSADPLNMGLALLELVEQRYREAGITDITTDYHDGARHEVFNETNRDEVTAHLLAWLQRFV